MSRRPEVDGGESCSFGCSLKSITSVVFLFPGTENGPRPSSTSSIFRARRSEVHEAMKATRREGFPSYSGMLNSNMESRDDITKADGVYFPQQFVQFPETESSQKLLSNMKKHPRLHFKTVKYCV